jgi:hypothetical protein
MLGEQNRDVTGIGRGTLLLYLTTQSHQGPDSAQSSYTIQGSLCRSLAHNRTSIMPLHDGRRNGQTVVMVTVFCAPCFACLSVVGIELLGNDVKKLLVVAEIDLGNVGERSSLEPHS